MPTVSLVIITYNEEDNISDCINSVGTLASEVIVLDSGSQDNTCTIAKNLGATVHFHTFDGHIQQKNRAQHLATSDWVLSLDADERLSLSLKSEIEKALEIPQFDGYEMNRLNFFGDTPIRTCGWYPDKKLRLWRKNSGSWKGINPHDKFELSNQSPIGSISADIHHFTYKNKDSMRKQVYKFANIAANTFANESYLYLLFKLIFSTPFKFIKSYFLHSGFSDGKLGLFICYQQTREVFLKYKLAIQFKMNQNE